MKFKDAIEITRPINCLMGALSIVIGLLNTRLNVPFDKLTINIILGVVTYIFIAASGNTINDIYDIEIDKINRLERPIPRGSISLKQAKGLFFLFLGIGIILSYLNTLIFSLTLINLALAFFFGFMAWVYAKWGKKSGFLGNIIVGVSFSIGLVYGAYLNSSIIPPYIFYFFITAFSLLVAREIIKGCEDIEGDKNQGVKTLAIKIGIKSSRNISVIFALLAVVFFILPVFTNILNIFLFIIFMIIGLIEVGYTIVLMLTSDLGKEDLKKISLLLKIGMFLGLIAFFFASL
ncbi:MAG TPA: geranylgeranylglycerol-phosphate geranylgeranyltransferase [Candidatus Nanopelagicaceae bacterium]|nr:geranylgeranylglycerol-phosphate geranylgeranyltransferase [Candidatus Nanopelagicaceae bacterium]